MAILASQWWAVLAAAVALPRPSDGVLHGFGISANGGSRACATAWLD